MSRGRRIPSGQSAADYEARIAAVKQDRDRYRGLYFDLLRRLTVLVEEAE